MESEEAPMKQVPAAHNGHELGEEGFVRRAHLHDPPELPVCVALIEHSVGRGPVSHIHTQFRTLQYGIAILGTLKLYFSSKTCSRLSERPA